jgi:hypothetical protein
MMNDFFDGGPTDVECARCGADHELVRPGKTQPTCDCDLKCHDHETPIPFEYRTESTHPPKPGRGGSYGYHCPVCHPYDGPGKTKIERS